MLNRKRCRDGSGLRHHHRTRAHAATIAAPAGEGGTDERRGRDGDDRAVIIIAFRIDGDAAAARAGDGRRQRVADVGEREVYIRCAARAGGDGVRADVIVGGRGDAGRAVVDSLRDALGEGDAGPRRGRGEDNAAAVHRLGEGAGHGDEQGRGKGGVDERALVAAAARHAEAPRLKRANVAPAALRAGDAALVGGEDATVGRDGVNGRGTGQEGVGLGIIPIVRQRIKQSCLIEQVCAVRGQATAGRVANQVVATRVDAPASFRHHDGALRGLPAHVQVPGNEGVGE